MKCKYCGAALDYKKAICPKCGKLLTPDQMQERKEYNGYNNPYAQRLDELNKKYNYKVEKNSDNKTIGISIGIVAILILITVIAVVIFINR